MGVLIKCHFKRKVRNNKIDIFHRVCTRVCPSENWRYLFGEMIEAWDVKQSKDLSVKVCSDPEGDAK